MRMILAATAAAALLAISPAALAQQSYTAPATLKDAIKGTMKIDFGTRTKLDNTGKAPPGSPALGATDAYAIDLDINNSVLLRGKIDRRPWIPSAILGRTLQEGYFDYDIRAHLKNPSNPTQTVTLGGWVGAMTLDGSGIYHLAQPPEGKGRLRMAIDSVGSIAGFLANFGGDIQGRIPPQAGLMGLADRASKKVNKTYTRLVNNQTVKVEVSGADPLSFNSVTLAQGPLAGYAESQVNGSIDYDSEEGIWYLDANVTYNAGGAQQKDRYSGTIRWNEDPARATNGKGFYEVNVRVNEKPATEADAFKAATADAEAAFFSTDVTVPGFTGKIAYVDTMKGKSVTGSQVTYNVDGNNVSRQQTMNFAKIVLLMTGPFNDE